MAFEIHFIFIIHYEMHFIVQYEDPSVIEIKRLTINEIFYPMSGFQKKKNYQFHISSFLQQGLGMGHMAANTYLHIISIQISLLILSKAS